MKGIKVKTYKEYDYQDLQEEWKTLGTSTIFSDFRTVDYDRDGKWIVSAPDLSVTEPLLPGKWTIVIEEWNDEPKRSIECEVTWKNIAYWHNLFNDGHHVFLESIEIKEDTKEVYLHSGS